MKERIDYVLKDSNISRNWHRCNLSSNGATDLGMSHLSSQSLLLLTQLRFLHLNFKMCNRQSVESPRASTSYSIDITASEYQMVQQMKELYSQGLEHHAYLIPFHVNFRYCDLIYNWTECYSLLVSVLQIPFKAHHFSLKLRGLNSEAETWTLQNSS